MPTLDGFEAYVSGLEVLAAEILLTPPRPVRDERMVAALDGGTSAALRRVVPILERREMGAFFTPSKLAAQGSEFFGRRIPGDAVFIDMACGGGDLLIAIAQLLPIDPDLGRTLKMWGKRLMGFDLQEEFIRATKARLVLLALARGARSGKLPVPAGEDLFPLIRQGDGLTQATTLKEATHIFINPPFLRIKAPNRCTWASAKVSAAAVFLDACVSQAKPGAKIVAILPDVLRSGSNYKKWREHIASKSSIEGIKVVGQFDNWTDVDVFMLRLKVGNGKGRLAEQYWGSARKENGVTVSDLFDVQVGRVVPYRDAEEGPSYPYIYPKVLPPWHLVRTFEHRRRFSGLAFKPPFIAVRRTSRFSHEYRAVGTIISGPEDVAVENHLIVLRPKDGSLRTCRKLLEVLRAPETNDWLNKRIRCRHLTVPALQEMPWWRIKE